MLPLLLFVLATPAPGVSAPCVWPQEEEREEDREEGQDGEEGEEAKPPTPEEAVQALKDAEKDDDPAVLRATLESVGHVADERVTKRVARSLDHADAAVRVAAVEALRWNEDPSALDRLLRARREKRLIEHPASGAAYMYALGQKADERCLDVLTDGLNATGDEDARIRQARILALGRIRDVEACEALVDFCWSGPLAARRHATEVRTALIVLTGVDAGKTGKEWVDWWNDHGKGLEISEDPWPLPNRLLQRRWDDLWMSPEEKERRAEERRREREEKDERDDEDGEADEERGNDPRRERGERRRP